MALIPHRKDCFHFDVCSIVKIDNCVEECGHYINVEKFTSYNNGSTPCRFFSRDNVFTGQSADGGNMYQSVPWCNHEPSQRAVP
jgi:hypothetical protein